MVKTGSISARVSEEVIAELDRGSAAFLEKITDIMRARPKGVEFLSEASIAAGENPAHVAWALATALQTAGMNAQSKSAANGITAAIEFGLYLGRRAAEREAQK